MQRGGPAIRRATPLVALTFLLGGAAGPRAQGSAARCAVTTESLVEFAEPSPSTGESFWYGSELLAVRLNRSGRWGGMGPERDYGDKLFWWRQGYSGHLEPQPELVVTARRLAGAAPAVSASRATNARHGDFGGWAMLVGLGFPAAGCWEVTGTYHDEAVSFVTHVGP